LNFISWLKTQFLKKLGYLHVFQRSKTYNHHDIF